MIKKSIKSKSPIKIKVFHGHDDVILSSSVEEFINRPEIRIIDIQFSIGHCDPERYDGIAYAYSVFYKEKTEDDEHPTTDILQ